MAPPKLATSHLCKWLQAQCIGLHSCFLCYRPQMLALLYMHNQMAQSMCAYNLEELEMLRWPHDNPGCCSRFVQFTSCESLQIIPVYFHLLPYKFGVCFIGTDKGFNSLPIMLPLENLRIWELHTVKHQSISLFCSHQTLNLLQILC